MYYEQYKAIQNQNQIQSTPRSKQPFVWIEAVSSENGHFIHVSVFVFSYKSCWELSYVAIFILNMRNFGKVTNFMKYKQANSTYFDVLCIYVHR